MYKVIQSERLQAIVNQAEERREKRKRQREIIHESFRLGIGIFIVMSVILKLLFKMEAWKIYAIADAITGAITNLAMPFAWKAREARKERKLYEGEKLEMVIYKAVKMFFAVAFVLGIVMNVKIWLGLSIHIGITIIVIGIICE